MLAGYFLLVVCLFLVYGRNFPSDVNSVPRLYIVNDIPNSFTSCQKLMRRKANSFIGLTAGRKLLLA